jgi:beta-galactosidase
MRTCLNGHWDILPLFENPGQNPAEINRQQFISNTYRVPSLFCNLYNQDDKGFYNPFDYPPQWSKTRDAWIKRTFTLAPDAEGKKIFLHFGAVMGHSKFWINGQPAGENLDPTMPVDLDITALVQPGRANEILLRVADLPRTEDKRPLAPDAGFMVKYGSGIWQDVYLEIKDPVYIKDFTYTTSYRTQKVKFQVDIENTLARIAEGQVKLTVQGFSLQVRKRIRIPSAGSSRIEFEMDTANLKFWSAENPHLYNLVIEIEDTAGCVLDRFEKKIGFKEIWIDGPDFYVNGKITHFYGDWGHRVHPYQQRPEYIRCWYRMLKDLGMNYLRLHTGPHDPIVYEIANEMGIYICGETALHGSHGDLATGNPEFWVNAFDHVRRFVLRDRNEVSLILWSAGNEMRWNAPVHLTLQEHPKVKELIQRLDPTHPVYFEGDSSLWDESKQEMISRHYGLEIAGEGWWDKSRPLHVGEMGKWHYGQPPENVMLGGNKCYESLYDAHYAAGLEAALIIERARINGVASLFPWNLTCLDNPPVPDQDVTLTWGTLDGPYPKPVKVPAHSSEFSWWQPTEPAWQKGSSYDLLKEAFKPETVFIHERQLEYFAGGPIHRKVTIVNDTEGRHEYELVCRFNGKDDVRKITVIPGGRHHAEYTFSADQPCNPAFNVILKRDGKLIAEKSQALRIKERKIAKHPAIKVFGDGSLDPFFKQAGWAPTRIKSLENLSSTDLLVIEKESVVEEQPFVDALIKFIDEGGRVLMMEQVVSIFKDMSLRKLNLVQAHAQTARLEDVNLSWWGEHAILGSGGTDFVAAMGYDKPLAGDFCSWVDVGTGDFGGGGLRQSALLEMRWGKGALIANTLELTTFHDKVPAAADVLDRVLTYLSQYQPKSRPDLILLDGAKTEALDLVRIKNGATAVISGITPETRAHYEKALGLHLNLIPIPDECQGILNNRTDLTEGISNEELFWMNLITYTPKENKNIPISNGFALDAETLQPLVSITRDRTFFEFITNYHSELFRSKVFCLFGNQNRKGILVGRLKIGCGQVILYQIKTPFAEEKRSTRLWSMIMSNLGAAEPQVLLAIGQGLAQHPPYPKTLHLLKDFTPDQYEKITTFKRNKERMDTSPELSLAPWTDLKAEDGQFVLPASGRVILLSYTNTPRPRKFMESVGGLPNPAHTTSIEIHGRGELEVFIERKKIFAGKIDGAQILPEVELEEGCNAVLYVLKNTTAQPFTVRWKTAAQKNEHELHFW